MRSTTTTGTRHSSTPNHVRYLVNLPDSKLTIIIAPPTYSAPIGGSYHDNTPTKGHQSYHQYASHASEPQELPAEFPSSSTQRYSELPAGADNRRFSELPAEATGPAPPSELESPQVSPRPVQAEFQNDMAKRASQGRGLGVMTEEGPSQRN